MNTYEDKYKNKQIHAQCATCGKDIYPHWKYCQEHTGRNILLDMDINKFGVSLNKKENDRLWALLEDEMKAHALLKEQYARLQDNFEMVLHHGVREYIDELSTYMRSRQG